MFITEDQNKSSPKQFLPQSTASGDKCSVSTICFSLLSAAIVLHGFPVSAGRLDSLTDIRTQIQVPQELEQHGLRDEF